MREFHPDQIDELAAQVEKNGDEILHIDTDLSEQPSEQDIDEMRYLIQCELEKALQNGVAVNYLPNPNGTISFYCHLKNIKPREKKPDGTMTKYVHQEVNIQDLKALSEKISENGTTTIILEQPLTIEEGVFIDHSIHKIKHYMEQKLKTPIVVRALDTADPRRKQFFICYKEYGNFNRKDLGTYDPED